MVHSPCLQSGWGSLGTGVGLQRIPGSPASTWGSGQVAHSPYLTVRTGVSGDRHKAAAKHGCPAPEWGSGRVAHSPYLQSGRGSLGTGAELRRSVGVQYPRGEVAGWRTHFICSRVRGLWEQVWGSRLNFNMGFSLIFFALCFLSSHWSTFSDVFLIAPTFHSEVLAYPSAPFLQLPCF